jgi:hypothetical protein
MLWTMKLRIVIAAVAAAIPNAALADSIKDYWAKAAPGEHFQSAKSSLALERCIGMEMSEIGLPIVIHGEGETILTAVVIAYITNPTAGVRIVEKQTSREVIVAARGQKEHMADVVRTCVS